MAALGGGDLKFNSILNALAIELDQPTEEIPVAVVQPQVVKKRHVSDIKVHGISNLLKQIANCCKPIPGDAIVGYITQGQGVSVHRMDCVNALHAKKIHPERFIEVFWGSETKKHYHVGIIIRAFDRQGLVRDITDVLASEGIAVTGLNCEIDKKDSGAKIKMSIEISGIKSLSQVLNRISKLPNINEVRRVD